MRNATRPRLLADVAAEMLHERGSATLTEILDAGRLLTDADDNELAACAMLVGGVWLGPAIATSEAGPPPTSSATTSADGWPTSCSWPTPTPSPRASCATWSGPTR